MGPASAPGRSHSGQAGWSMGQPAGSFPCWKMRPRGWKALWSLGLHSQESRDYSRPAFQGPPGWGKMEDTGTTRATTVSIRALAGQGHESPALSHHPAFQTRLCLSLAEGGKGLVLASGHCPGLSEPPAREPEILPAPHHGLQRTSSFGQTEPTAGSRRLGRNPLEATPCLGSGLGLGSPELVAQILCLTPRRGAARRGAGGAWSPP